MKSICFYDTSIGRIGIAENGKEITDLWFADKAGVQGTTIEDTGAQGMAAAYKSDSGRANPGKVNSQKAPAGETAAQDEQIRETPLLKKAAAQLKEYFDGKRKAFDLPLALEGTSFQTAVWKALLTIPYGETRSYGDIALSIGNSKACRAVGMANNRNRIAIIVPCHRVIGANGKLVGYGGGLDKKDKLLALEKKNITNK